MPNCANGNRCAGGPIRLPWRQLLLMSLLCFGIAVFVLPDTVNENLNWLLYGLMAASFFAGLRHAKPDRQRLAGVSRVRFFEASSSR